MMRGLLPLEHAVLCECTSPGILEVDPGSPEARALETLRAVARVRFATCPCGRHVGVQITPAGLAAKRIHETILATLPTGVP